LGHRVRYEVRVREQTAPQVWQKKSKFYWAKSPSDAQRKYKGGGFIMWTRKASTEKKLGIGGFFGLGDQLLKEFAQARKEGGDRVQQILNKDIKLPEQK